MTPRNAIPSSWADRLQPGGSIGIGLDLATSTKGTANPSAVSVIERVGRLCYTRLMASWKTADPVVTEQILTAILDDIESRDLKARRLSVDSSNERFFARRLRATLTRRIAVSLIAGNDKLRFRGEDLDAKTLLGNLYATAIEDGLLLLPAGDWIMLDHRLVKREAGGFVTDTGPNGEHGDCFDAGKHAYYALQIGGAVRADALQVGTFGNPKAKNPRHSGSLQKSPRAHNLA